MVLCETIVIRLWFISGSQKLLLLDCELFMVLSETIVVSLWISYGSLGSYCY